VRVARRAHVILPYHRVLDGIEEVKADDDAGDEVGTTGRGIGPTYEDKAGRRGIRVADLLDPDVLRDKLEYAVPQKRALVEDVYGLKLEGRTIAPRRSTSTPFTRSSPRSASASPTRG